MDRDTRMTWHACMLAPRCPSSSSSSSLSSCLSSGPGQLRGWTSRLTIQPVQASCHYPLWQTPHTFSFLSPSRSSPILVLPARFNTHTGPLCALLDEPRNPNPNPDPLRTDGPGSRRCAIPSTDEPARPIPRETRSGLQDASRGEAVQGGSWVESSRIFTKMDVQLQYTDAVSSLDK
jgi:hypothetical protein